MGARKARRSNSALSSTTTPTTIGVRSTIWSLASARPATLPPTWSSTPGMSSALIALTTSMVRASLGA